MLLALSAESVADGRASEFLIGRLLVATPNPASLIVHLHEFWRDPTHVRLYSRPLLEFLFHWAGLEKIESGENPYTAWTSSDEMQEIPVSLEEIESVKNYCR